MKKILVLPALLIWISVQAQHSAGIETQIYPAGYIHSLHLGFDIGSNLTLASGIGLNVIDRKDWGVHQNEEGKGFGFNLGIERNNLIQKNISLSFQTYIWVLNIDWFDSFFDQECLAMPVSNRDCATSASGNSRVVVFQPTIHLSYQINLTESFFIKSGISFGYEINIHTIGEEVGQGPILLGGIQLMSYIF